MSEEKEIFKEFRSFMLDKKSIGLMGGDETYKLIWGRLYEHKISQLQEQNKVLLECAEFYGDSNSYDLGSDTPSSAGYWKLNVHSETLGVIDDEFIDDGGKRARETIKKYKEIGSGE